MSDDWLWIVALAGGAYLLWRNVASHASAGGTVTATHASSAAGAGTGSVSAPQSRPTSSAASTFYAPSQGGSTVSAGSLAGEPSAALYGTFSGSSAASYAHAAAAQLASQYPGRHFAVVQSGPSYDPTYEAVLQSTTGTLPVSQIRSSAATEGIIPTVVQLDAANSTAKRDAIIASDLGTLTSHGGTAADITAYLQQEWGYGTTEAQAAAQSVALTGTWFGKSLGPSSVSKGASTGGTLGGG